MSDVEINCAVLGQDHRAWNLAVATSGVDAEARAELPHQKSLVTVGSSALSVCVSGGTLWPGTRCYRPAHDNDHYMK